MKLKDFDFRVWSKKEGKYINKNNLIGFKFDNDREIQVCSSFTRYTHIKETGESTWFSPLFYKSDDLEIELFTGFHDRAGNKVYEGDILGFNVKGEWANGRVFYNNNEAMFLVDCEDEGGWLYVVSLHTLKDKIKSGIIIVGSVHLPKSGLIRIKGE